MIDVLSSESKVSKNGQISLPAELRRRWNVQSVLFLDKGDHAVVVPVPDDPIGALYGKYAGLGPTTDEIRAEEQAAEAEREERLYRAAGREWDE